MTQNQKYSHTLLAKMKAFYKKYYLEDLALNDWEERFEKIRMNEEEVVGKRLIEALKQRGFDFENKKVLILGAGTGAEGFYIHNCCNSIVTFLEPNPSAIEILNEKSELFNSSKDRIISGVGEEAPFPDANFDIILCYTVLEHVQDIGRTLSEIHRMLKRNGKGIIITPNYNYPEEPHYKIRTFPPAYLKSLVKIHLKLKNRYTPFFETLNFITPSSIIEELKSRTIPFEIQKDLFPPNPKGILGLFIKVFKLERNQFIILTKN